jgi:hypothetical protein
MSGIRYQVSGDGLPVRPINIGGSPVHPSFLRSFCGFEKISEDFREWGIFWFGKYLFLTKKRSGAEEYLSWCAVNRKRDQRWPNENIEN